MASVCPFASAWAAEQGNAAITAAVAISGHGYLQSSSRELPFLHLNDSTSFSRSISTPSLPASFESQARADDASVPSSSFSSEAPANQSSPQPPVATVNTQKQRVTRRQLRQLGKAWSLCDVRQHTRKDDAWIAVNGRVYDISEHLMNHPGWTSSADISSALSILAHAGTDCSEEFKEIHRPYPVAWRQLRTYYIGDLAPAATEL